MADDELSLEQQKRALEAFVTNNSDLEKLEELSASFNLFEAIGMKNQEIRHSKTLAFLLGPQNDHGLGQYFLKRILKRIALEAQNDVSIVDIDIANFANAETRCEWNRIDILISCPEAKLVVALENKVLAGEHGDQLSRYKQVLDDHPEWADFRKVFAFLTVDGHAPADAVDGEHWCSISYTLIVDELENSLIALQSKIGTDQSVLIRHYIDLLRRNVLEDSEIAELARKIYQAHPKALDIIFEHKPDLREEIRNYLIAKIEVHPDLRVGPFSGRYLRFVHKDWQFNPNINAAAKSFKTEYVAFEFNINTEGRSITLELVIGNVPEAKRQELLESISIPLKYRIEWNGQSHPRGWRYSNLKYQDSDVEDSNKLYGKIDGWWNSFVDSADHFKRVFPVVGEALRRVTSDG